MRIYLLFLLAGLVAAAPGHRMQAQDRTPFTLRDAVALSHRISPLEPAAIGLYQLVPGHAHSALDGIQKVARLAKAVE